MTLDQEFRYDVCLSYAGEDRAYVSDVAHALWERGVRVFFDGFETLELWGKELVTHLDTVYRKDARYCVLFVSRHYAAKRWPRYERESALARSFEEDGEYLLPVRFDDTEVPGLRPTVGWLDARQMDVEALASAIVAKIGHEVESYFPRVPDVLFDRLKVRGDPEREDAASLYGRSVYDTLREMSDFERRVIYTVFVEGCHSELPDNVHIELDKLRRYTGAGNDQVLGALAGLQPLGIVASARRARDVGHLGEDVLAVVEWHYRRVRMPANITRVAMEVIWTAREGWCEEHGMQALERLDFSRLASSTPRDSC